MENLLANQETLNKQMSGVTIKDEVKDLSSDKKKNYKEKFQNGEGKQRRKQGDQQKGHQYRSPQLEGAKWGTHNNNEWEGKRNFRKNGKYYNYGKNGHFTRSCQHKKKKRSVAASTSHESELDGICRPLLQLKKRQIFVNT